MEAMDIKNFFFRYPYMIQTGPITFFGMYRPTGASCNYSIHLKIPKYPLITDAEVTIFKRLHQMPVDIWTEMETDSTILDGMNAIERELAKNASLPEVDCVVAWTSRMQSVLKQIESIRRDESYKICVSRDYTKIKISNFSEYGIGHYLDLSVNDAGTDIFVSSHSLPSQFDGMFKLAGKTIETHLTPFLGNLELLGTFYEYLNTIDELCFVVAPIDITTKMNQRVFKIEENIYVKIEVDPLSPDSLITTIIGPTYGIQEFNDKFNKRINDWDVSVDIHSNLLRIFDKAYFPLKQSDRNEEHEKPCDICFAYRFNKEFPYISCDNPKCFSVYHSGCLKKWFARKPESKTFLYVTTGKCPYCTEKLSTSFINVIEGE